LKPNRVSRCGRRPHLIETADLNDVDPEAWLADTLARIADYKITKIDDILPWSYEYHHLMKDAA